VFTGERDMAAAPIDIVFRSSLLEKHEGPALLSEDWPFIDLILLQRRRN
jgi:hypothetical protein